MKQFPFYGWNPSDFKNSIDVQMMTETQELLYRRLLDALWMANPQCYLPNDHALLAKIVGFRRDKFEKNFKRIELKLEKISRRSELNPEIIVSYLFNKRQVEDLERCREVSIRQSDKGKRSGVARQPRLNRGSISVEPHREEKEKGDIEKEKHPTSPAPPAAPSGAVRDLAFDEFAELWEEKFGMKYDPEKKNFVQLARLRKKLGLTGKAVPEDWSSSLKNFFESPLSEYSLADLCVRYHLFRKSALDRFGKIIDDDSRDMGWATSLTKYLEEKGKTR